MAYGAMVYAICGADLAHGAMCYANASTDMAYASSLYDGKVRAADWYDPTEVSHTPVLSYARATRCPLLTCAMLLRVFVGVDPAWFLSSVTLSRYGPTRDPVLTCRCGPTRLLCDVRYDETSCPVLGRRLYMCCVVSGTAAKGYGASTRVCTELGYGASTRVCTELGYGATRPECGEARPLQCVPRLPLPTLSTCAMRTLSPYVISLRYLPTLSDYAISLQYLSMPIAYALCLRYMRMFSHTCAMRN
eukprot:3042979-Rhodomonas_salina.1